MAPFPNPAVINAEICTLSICSLTKRTYVSAIIAWKLPPLGLSIVVAQAQSVLNLDLQLMRQVGLTSI